MFVDRVCFYGSCVLRERDIVLHDGMFSATRYPVCYRIGVKMRVKISHTFGVCLIFTKHLCDELYLQEFTARKLKPWLMLGNKQNKLYRVCVTEREGRRGNASLFPNAFKEETLKKSKYLKVGNFIEICNISIQTMK